MSLKILFDNNYGNAWKQQLSPFKGYLWNLMLIYWQAIITQKNSFWAIKFSIYSVQK